jgi:transcriptional accessory protein Tex/SPT6
MEIEKLKSKYFKLTKLDFTKEEVEEVISDLGRFSEVFAKSIETKAEKKEREKRQFEDDMESASPEGWGNP